MREESIDTEIFHIGTKPISGCLACGSCRKTGRCVISDSVNAFLEKAKDADGFVFGSPVHYAAMGGAMTSFMDRAFYAAIGGDMFYLKPGACVVSARRAGTTAAFDQFIKYLTIREMPVISSQYWNVVHGNTPGEVRQDLEGMQIMRTLARIWPGFCAARKPPRSRRRPPSKRAARRHKLYPLVLICFLCGLPIFGSFFVARRYGCTFLVRYSNL